MNRQLTDLIEGLRLVGISPLAVEVVAQDEGSGRFERSRWGWQEEIRLAYERGSRLYMGMDEEGHDFERSIMHYPSPKQICYGEIRNDGSDLPELAPSHIEGEQVVQVGEGLKPPPSYPDTHEGHFDYLCSCLAGQLSYPSTLIWATRSVMVEPRRGHDGKDVTELSSIFTTVYGELDEPEQRDYALSLVGKALDLITSSYYRSQHLKSARQAAATAIMTRNLSHNVGSHVVPRASLERIAERIGGGDQPGAYRVAAELKRRLDDLLQWKGDFLAEVTTEPLATTRPALLFREVMLPLIQNTLLTDNLARNEHIGFQPDPDEELDPGEIKGKVTGDCQLEFYLQYGDSDPLGLSYQLPGQTDHAEFVYPSLPYTFPFPSVEAAAPSEKGVADKLAADTEAEGEKLRPVVTGRDVEVALPGPIGQLAVYGLLENFVRNLAKHHQAQLSEDDARLKIRLHIDPPSKEFLGRSGGDEKGETDEDGRFYAATEDPNTFVVHLTSNVYQAKDDDEREELGRFLKQFRKHRKEFPDLIDHKGELIREWWGMAEMRICANLLRGEPSMAPDDLNAALDLGWNYDKTCLSYRLRIQKSKLACVVHPSFKGDVDVLEDSEQRAALQRLGVWGFGTMKELRDHLLEHPAAFKFAVLCTDPSEEDVELLYESSTGTAKPTNEVGKAEERRRRADALLPRLPFRVLVDERFAKDEQIAPLAKGKAKRLITANVASAVEELLVSDDPVDAVGAFASMLWEQWVTGRFDARGAQVLLHLQAGGTENQWAWGDVSDVFESKPLGLHVFEQNGHVPEAKRRLVYDRHGLAGEELARVGTLSAESLLDQTHAYEVLDKASADFVRVFSPYFPGDDEARGRWTLPWELAEAGLLTVLVVDERLAERAHQPESVAHGVSMSISGRQDLSRIELAAAANVLICTHIQVNDDSPTHLRALVNGEGVAGRADQGADDVRGSDLALHEGPSPRRLIVRYDTSAQQVQVSWRCSDGTPSDVQPDLVIIHQGIIERLGRSQYKIAGDDLLNHVRKTIPYVVVDSGRGVPPELCDDVKFMPYSLVQHYLQDRIAKLSLTTAVMSLGRRPKPTRH